MIISNKNKYIYFHNPKCAGTTIGKILAKSCCSQDILVGGYRSRARDSVEFDKNSMLYRKKHIGITKFEQMNYTGLSDYFKFGFTRNPYAWAVSWYTFWFEWKGGRSRKVPSKKHWWKIQHMNFSEFLRYEWFTNTKTAADMFLRGKTDKQLVDFIGKVENLQEDFNTICDKIGIPQQHLPHKNKSKHKHYTEYYDDETRQIVAEKYKKDIEYFGYEFGD